MFTLESMAKRPPQQTRVPLDRERILRAALAITDEAGIEALTMRRLGAELGFEGMSLYHHVASKDDLLDGMLDLVLDETQPPAASEPWDAAIRASALSVHEALRRHPWACRLLMSAARIRPARLRYMDSLLERLHDAGFDADLTYNAYHVLDAHIFGFSLWLAAYTYDTEQAAALAASLDDFIPPGEYPHLNEHARQHMSEGPHHDVDAFALGLDLLLDGLKRTRSG